MQRRADRQALLEACARVEDGIEALSRMSPLSCFITVASDLSAIVGGPELLECAGVGEDQEQEVGGRLYIPCQPVRLVY